MTDVAVVAGASQGIGAATTQRLAADGYHVIAAARSGDKLERVAASHVQITPVVADVASDEDVERLLRSATDAGRLTAWVNTAATLRNVPFDLLDTAVWRAVLDVSLDGTFRCCRAAYRAMAASGGGTIVNIASLSGVQNVEKFPGLAAYNVAKAGVIALSEAVALEGRDNGVRCICVSPGAVDTEMLRAANPSLRPGMTAEDAAAIIAWLLTPEAAPLSGSNIPIFSNA
ncbi:MAG: SDR family oxidoreductase [Candidatus Dormibacteria bacterium]